MADEWSMALASLLDKAGGDGDFLREGVRVLSQALMELEVAQQLGAERHERTASRTGVRNGYRERQWDTRVGTLDLRVPRDSLLPVKGKREASVTCSASAWGRRASSCGRQPTPRRAPCGQRR